MAKVGRTNDADELSVHLLNALCVAFAQSSGNPETWYHDNMTFKRMHATKGAAMLGLKLEVLVQGERLRKRKRDKQDECDEQDVSRVHFLGKACLTG